VPKSLPLFLHIYVQIASSFVNAGAYSREIDFSCIRSNLAVYWVVFTYCKELVERGYWAAMLCIQFLSGSYAYLGMFDPKDKSTTTLRNIGATPTPLHTNSTSQKIHFSFHPLWFNWYSITKAHNSLELQ